MSGNQRIEYAPVLQTMREYIENHFMDEITETIFCALKSNGISDMDIDVSGKKVVLEADECNIVRADFWREDRTHLIADMKVKVSLGVAQDAVPYGKRRL